MEEPLEVSIEYPGGSSIGSIVVTPLANRRYRLELDPLSCLMAEGAQDLRELPSYGDVIEAEQVGESSYRELPGPSHALAGQKLRDTGSGQKAFERDR